MFNRPKYGNRRVKIDNITFDSTSEAERFQLLKILLSHGNISQLRTHPRYWIQVRGAKAFQYEADFEYVDHNGKLVVEDIKGFITPMSKLKMKCFQLEYPDIKFVMLKFYKKAATFEQIELKTKRKKGHGQKVQ